MKKLFTFILFVISINSGFSQILPLPSRLTTAQNGTQIISTLTPLSLTAREDTIFWQIINGNVPDFLRNLVEITSTVNISGTNHTINYFVIPDYMAIGCDSDYFLCPMTPLLAQRIADYIGFSLPTRKMVDDIWQTATVKMAPQSISPSPQMTTVPVFATHDSMVWNQRLTFLTAHPLGELISGDKKDVIISNHIYGNPAPCRVVIYGWHYQNGTPIQPLYYGHEETYADYSHGIRLVQNEIYVDGCLNTVQNILQSAILCILLSDEGVISNPRYPITPPNITKPISFCVLDNNLGSIKIIAKNVSNILGYKISLSHDGKCFELPQNYSGNNITINNLTVDTIIYVKIAAIGFNGGVSEYSEVLGATTKNTNYYSHYLVINAFDRVTAGNTFDFIRQHGSSINNIGQCFSSATNEAVTDSLILLNNFNALDYIVGEESTANETFSAQEQLMLTNCNVPYFISGSEIGWDLDYLGSATDKDFYHNYLYATYVEDAPNNQSSTYYNATLTPPNISPILFTFDDGTNDTYDVRYPDVITPNTIGTWQGEQIAYFDAFPAKCAGSFYWNKMVYLTIPFETIYPESKRDEIMNIVNTIFFMMNSKNEINKNNDIRIFPNPANKLITIQSSFNLCNNEITIYNIQGVEMLSFDKLGIVQHDAENKITIDISMLPEGLYFVTIKGKEIFYKEKIIVIR